MKYIAKAQLIYPHRETGEEIKVEQGSEVLHLADSSLQLEIEAGNIEIENLTLDEAISAAIKTGIDEAVSSAVIDLTEE